MVSRNIFKLGALEAPRTAFLLCDVQEIFRPHIKYFSEVVKVANKMMAAAKHFEIPVYISEQYPKGLGHTCKDINTTEAALVYEKTKFSMYTPELEDRLKKDVPKLQSVVLFGIEAHVCIEQTVIDLLSKDLVVHVLADGVSSRSLMDRGLALQRMGGLSCFVTTSENVHYKLMKDKKHPQFKFISKLNKEPTVDTLGFTHKLTEIKEDRMAALGCFITTAENVLFKLMKDKKHPQFKHISKLNKEPTRLQSIGVFVGTSENVLFKLMGDKNHPAFKQISKLSTTPTPDEFGLSQKSDQL